MPATIEWRPEGGGRVGALRAGPKHFDWRTEDPYHFSATVIDHVEQNCLEIIAATGVFDKDTHYAVAALIGEMGRDFAWWVRAGRKGLRFKLYPDGRINIERYR